MALRVVCIACFDGDHANHRRIVRAAPRDGVGGDICDCQGECAANGVAACSTFDCNRPAATNGRCENCERIVSLLRDVKGAAYDAKVREMQDLPRTDQTKEETR